MSAAPGIVWIASYPKSGNTWVRFILCNLLFGSQTSAAGLNNLAPDIHELGPLALASHMGLVKTHFLLSPAMPLVERSLAGIYVVRHPADVLLSNFHYARRSAGLAEASRREFDEYFDEFLQHRGDPRWIRGGMGSWEESVRAWLFASRGFPVVPIKYEDLKADPMTACQMLVERFALKRSAQEIRQAVADSSFDRLREIEMTDIRERRVGIFYKPYLQPAIGAGRRFMRKGVSGEGMEHLTAEQRTRLQNAFESLTSSLGY